jgi:hypothetical protein
MTMNRMFLRSIVVGFFLCLTGSLAFGAGAPRTFVRTTGADSGTCDTTATPCRTFSFALGKTTVGGEIDVLDSGDFQPVTINQSVSIVAEGVVGGISVTSVGDAIDVSVGANDVVVLRGLTIIGGDPTIIFVPNNGIAFSSSGTLHIEGCTIEGFSAGVEIVPASGQSRVFIKDTIVRDGKVSGIHFEAAGATVTASLDNVRTENNNPSGTLVVNNAQSAIEANASGGGRAVINLERTIVSGNGTGVRAAGASSTINMSNVTVVNNITGLKTANGGQIVSFSNNKIASNTTNGSPTKTISQH